MEGRQPQQQNQQYQQQPQQQNQQYQQQPQQQNQRPSRFNEKKTIELIAPYLIMVGAILIGIGVIIMGFAPGNITLEDTNYSGDSADIELSITPITVGAILAGIGGICSGIGGGLNVKAYWDRKNQERPPSKRFQ